MDICKNPLVSVVINCFNGETFLEEAINSVLCQTYTNWEIIFWDNQSTDLSENIYKKISDARLRYFLAPRFTKLGEARNLAVEKANGDWIAFLDCDDIWSFDKLEKQVSAIQEFPKIGLVYSYPYFFESPKNEKFNYALLNNFKFDKERFPIGEIFDSVIINNFIIMSSIMVKKSTYKELGGVNGKLVQAEDFDLLCKILNRYKANIGGIVAYRIHQNNFTSHQELERHLESIEISKQYLPRNSAKIALKIYYTDLAYYYIKKLKFKQFYLIINNASIIKLFTVIIFHFKAAIYKIYNRGLV